MFCFDVHHLKKSLYWLCYNIAVLYVLGFWPQAMWNLSSLFRDWTCTPYFGRWSFNPWTTKEVPSQKILISCLYVCMSLFPLTHNQDLLGQPAHALVVIMYLKPWFGKSLVGQVYRSTEDSRVGLGDLLSTSTVACNLLGLPATVNVCVHWCLRDIL